MKNGKNVSLDLVEKAEKIINVKFGKDYTPLGLPRAKVFREAKYSVADIACGLCKVAGCLFLAFALVLIR